MQNLNILSVLINSALRVCFKYIFLFSFFCFYVMRIENVEIRQVFNTNVVEKSGREYLDIKSVRIQLIVSKLNIYFNSRTGSEEINDTVNKVVNENWKDIYYELKPDLEKSIGDVIKSLVKPMFDEMPYEDFFLP